MKNIAIIPTIRSPYKNQIEYCFDKNISALLRKVFKKINIINLFEGDKLNKKIDLLVISGGNDILKFSSKENDYIRYQFTKKIFNHSKKKGIPIIGICYGAQFVADYFNSTFVKKKKIGIHYIILNKNNFIKSNKKRISNNSYKNILIKKVPKFFDIIAKSKDNYVEAFYIKKINFLGLQWHPERNKNLKKFDIRLLKKLI